MAKGTFQAIAETYQVGANNSFEYSSEVHIILKPFFYLYALVIFITLYIASFLFYLLIIFDWLASLINWIRIGLLNSIEYLSDNTDTSFLMYIFYPILLTFISLIFIVSSLIPKLSSEIDSDDYYKNDIFDISGIRTFQFIISITFNTIRNLWNYSTYNGVFVFALLLIPFVFNSLLMLALALVLIPFIIFDFLSFLVEFIRKLTISISNFLSESIYDYFLGFFISPIIMLILVPVFIGILIIPKFSSVIDGAC